MSTWDDTILMYRRMLDMQGLW